uniref:Uncharacterized protein n=1 Tax=viral metagenome TaxID=1070528 RepID=A0A6H1ZC30_9ZZZZ
MKVAFREFKSNGEIVAIFPEIPCDLSGHNCMSYLHIGQHSACDPVFILKVTKPAENYQELLEEIEKIYDDDVEVIKRINKPCYVKERLRYIAQNYNK